MKHRGLFMNDIKLLLTGLGVPQYFENFEENDIDISMIAELTSEDLKEIGVASLGHRKKILSAFKGASSPAQSAGEGTAQPAGGTLDEWPDEWVERREVTTVFADLTGYTRLSREMETEDLHEVLTAFFDRFNEIVTRMGGTIDRHIGDCVMAVFGAPVSHGNDAERALRATIEMHHAMEDVARHFGRDLSAHIGAAAGNVLFSRKGYGQRKEQDFTLTGDTVNLASRLADQANARETLIDDHLCAALSHMIACDAPVELEVKGFDKPILGHRLVEFRRLAPNRALIGRETEMQVFRTALVRCKSGGNGETLYLSADAGMGKSRLLQEITSEGGRLGFDFHSTLVLDFGLGGAQNPINALIGSLCGLSENAHSSAIDAVVERLTEDTTLDAISALFLRVMLGAELDRSKAAIIDAMSDTSRIEGQNETVRRLVRHFSAQQPKLLAIEDIHWAGATLLPTIRTLQEESQTNPLVLVITSRPEGPITEMEIAPIESSSRIRHMSLGALSGEMALELANASLHPSADIVQQCVERAQGNPLFLEQLLRHTRDTDDLIPGSIQSLIQARFDRLAPVDRRVLQCAAILGQRFSLAAVTQIAGIDVYDERPLVEASLIRQIEDGYLFDHALIREAVLSTILRKDLQALHRLAAAWFKPRDIALHAEHLGAAKDEAAAEAYLAAAHDARGRFRKDAALDFAEKGLAAAALFEDAQMARTGGQLLRIKGDMLRELGQGEASIAAFMEARDVADLPCDTCLALIGMVSAMRILDRIDEAFALLDEAQAIAEPEGFLLELSEIHYYRGSLHFPRGNLDECLDDHTKSLDFAKQADRPERQALALSGLGDAHYARGRMFTAHSVIEECLSLCEQHGLGAAESSNRFMLATVKIYMNETAEALDHAQRSAALAAEVGLNRPEIVSRLTAGWILTSMARYAEARAEIEAGLALADQLGAKRFEPFLEETLARIELAEGHSAKAAEVAEGAKIKLHEVGAETFIGPWVLSTVALTTPDADRRATCLADGEALLEKGCVGHNYFRFYCNAMEACLNASDWAQATRYADALAAYTAEEPTPWSDFYIARTRALVARAQGDTATEITRLRQLAEDKQLFDALPLLADA